MPRFLVNFQNLKKITPQNPLGIWEISQMPGYLGSFPNAWTFGKNEYMSPTAVEYADLSQQVSASDMTHKQGFNLY